MTTLTSREFWTGALIFLIVCAVLAAIAVPATVIASDNNLKTRQMISKCYDNGGVWLDYESLCQK